MELSIKVEDQNNKTDVRLQIAILSIEKQDSNGNRVSYNRLAGRSSVGRFYTKISLPPL
ncbi:hypothetical protein INT48_009653 [Thamnidium elegans]|uniref:Uncharacterized protein n=1 Tax=Thamnidium elegans TaxID=101142 RepID=A0A8H7SWL2_9FUNG|nr:hypothetical protein INT48_009653 [Thamnidium elegans]